MILSFRVVLLMFSNNLKEWPYDENDNRIPLVETKSHLGKDGKGKEHGGKEHGGEEHGGQEHGGKEHGGKEHGGG